MNDFRYKILKNSGINHYGKLTFHNNKEIETPVRWFGLSLIESKEFQLEIFKKAKIEAFLSNAFDLYYTDKKEKRKSLITDLQELKLCHKMDSGGFQLMKAGIKGTSNKFPLTPEMVLEKQLEIGCECGVQLDFPFGPKLTKIKKKKRLDQTIRNLEIVMKLINRNGVDFTILPVIHTVSDDHDLLNYGLEKIEGLLGGPPGLVGIGSLVPLVKSMEKNGIKSFLYALISLRKTLPDSCIHAFGIGGTMAYLAVLSGIDSYDSNGWIQKTAYGVIQLPGTSDRYLKKENHNRSYLIKERKLKHSKKVINEIAMFMNCSCEACHPYNPESWKEKDWKLKQQDFTGRSQEAKLLRGIHNVSLYQDELLKIREAIKNEQLVEFIKSRLENSIFYKYISFVEKLKEENIENLRKFKVSSRNY